MREIMNWTKVQRIEWKRANWKRLNVKDGAIKYRERSLLSRARWIEQLLRGTLAYFYIYNARWALTEILKSRLLIIDGIMQIIKWSVAGLLNERRCLRWSRGRRERENVLYVCMQPDCWRFYRALITFSSFKKTTLKIDCMKSPKFVYNSQPYTYINGGSVSNNVLRIDGWLRESSLKFILSVVSACQLTFCWLMAAFRTLIE